MRPAAGRLLRTITIQEQTEEQSESGALLDEWNDVVTVSASIEPLVGKELEVARGIANTISHKVIIRYLPDISTKNRIAWNGRTFSLSSVINIEERNESLSIYATELVV